MNPTTSSDAWLSEQGSMAFPTMLGALAAIIGRLPGKKNERSPDDEFALIAAVKAYYKTKTYLDRLKQTGAASRSEQMDIAKAWEMAGMMFSKFDSTLSSRLSVKARYWQDSSTWSPGNIDQVLLALQSIDHAIKKEN